MQDMLASLPQLKEVKEKVSLRFPSFAWIAEKCTVVAASHDGGEVYGVIREEEAASIGLGGAGPSTSSIVLMSGLI